ncbi:MAG: discoidin domain-containing protein [Eubacterium sp.]|nr:discoidin domain-containing protein [Eubacterium sp.]
MNSKIKKFLAVVLTLTLLVGGLSVFAPKKTTTTAVAKQKTVYDEIKVSKLSKEELDGVAKEAIVDGKNAAKEVNSYKNKEDYNAALNSAMTSFYKKDDKKQLKAFVNNLDKRAGKVAVNYEKAAKERSKGSKNGFVPGEITAIFDANVSKEDIKAVCKSQDAKLKKCFKIHTGEYMSVIEISMSKTVDQASKDFSEFSFVKAADSNDLAEPTEIENPQIASQDTMSPETNSSSTVTAMTNDNLTEAFHFDNMRVKGAWDYLSTHAHQKVKVAVIDIGCYYDNPDITNVITDDSYDMVAKKPIREVTYNSQQYHGTAVIGTIAAEANNGKLIAGVGSGYDNSVTEILAIQAGDYYPDRDKYLLPNSAVFEGLNYAYEHGAKAVNMSFGSLGVNSSYDYYLRKLYNAGIVLISSAGNDNSSEIHYPSDSKYVISVGATYSTNIRASFSNYGSEKDICAPGASIPCLSYDNNSITLMNGTSFSSPATTGVAAMMLSVNPDLLPYDVGRIMQNTDRHIADFETNAQFSHGIVNAEKCVRVADDYDLVGTFEGEEADEFNIASQANVTVSNPVSQYPASNLVDENVETLGAVASGATQNIVLNFNETIDAHRIVLHYANSYSANFKIYYSTNGVTYSNLGYSSSGTIAANKLVYNLTYNGIDTRKLKSIKIEYTNCSETISLKEIQVWADQTYTRSADSCTLEEPIYAPKNLRAEILGYHRVKLTWDVDARMIAKGYEYDVYDEGTKVATVTDNTIILENSVGRAGGLSYAVQSKYNGEVSDIAATYSTAIVWDHYLTTEPTTEEVTTEAQTETTTEEITIPAVNLALNKTAYASSNENGDLIAGKAFDGNESTRWSSQWTDDEWIYVDLGSIYQVGRMNIKWEAARAASYDVYISINGTTWNKITSNSQNAENTTDYLGGVYARYIKVAGTSRNTTYGYSIYEMEVYGKGGETTTAPETTEVPTTIEQTTVPETTTEYTRRYVYSGYTLSNTNIATGKTAYASSEENGDLSAGKTIDGDMSTRWSSQWTDDEWIVVDLGEEIPIGMVKLYWETAMGKDYDLQFSVNGNDWYDKRSTRNNSMLNTTEAFLPEYTRYIRVKGIQRATGYGYSLYEIEVFPVILNN